MVATLVFVRLAAIILALLFSSGTDARHTTTETVTVTGGGGCTATVTVTVGASTSATIVVTTPTTSATSISTTVTTGKPTTTTTGALNPSCAPGGNFDLSLWELQLPIGSKGNPTTILSSALQGCSGYSNPSYFFTESGDGALVMQVPGSPSSSGCVTTANSLHCRTELREVNSWAPTAATNQLIVELAVTTPDNSAHGIVIGQIHMDPSLSTKPVAELFYSSGGVISMGVEQTRAGGNEVLTTIGTIPVGTKFSYVISYENNVLSVSLNGGAAKTLSTYSLNAPLSYFKAGNYEQGSNPSVVKFYSIVIKH